MNARTKLALIATAALLLTGCAKEPQKPVPGQTVEINPDYDTVSATRVAVVNGNTIYKFCDGPNLVYVSDAYHGNAVAVVGNASECAR